MRLMPTLTALAFLASACAAPPPLTVPDGGPIPVPAANPPAAMRIAAVPSGSMFAKAGLAYEGGGMDDPRTFFIGALLVQHPDGALLFDAGFGPSVDEHFRIGTPLLFRAASRYERKTTVAEELSKAGIAPSTLRAVILTHAHWDHVSGLEALPQAPVWVSRDELAFVNGSDRATALARRLGTGRYQAYDFPNGPYLGFERSRDVFGDGSVVLVPAGGHTPGSIIAFINPPGGKRYALIGDIAWQTEGVARPAEKPWITRRVDSDREGTRALLIRLHQLKAAVPGLVIVPAHDARVWRTLPPLGAVSPPAATASQ
ncbi:MAG TPA: MBL fold metallo-hydrolase [Caulobacter sp.]|nr:MBL fold metallo-hydrolase [Caulobacter sp.]